MWSLIFLKVNYVKWPVFVMKLRSTDGDHIDEIRIIKQLMFTNVVTCIKDF